MTAKQEQWYQDALRAFANGSSWEGMKSLTWCAACLGIDPEEVVADARAVGKGHRAGDIRRGIRTAIEKGAGAKTVKQARRTPRQAPPPVYRGTVRDYVAAGRGATPADLAALAPFPFEAEGPRATAAWIRALCPWRPEALLFVTTKRAVVGRLGQNIRPAGEWAAKAERGEDLGGDLVTPNPLTGREGLNGEGRPSLTVKECLEPLPPFYILEFDEMPEADQYAFWAGFLQRSALRSNLVSLVHSGRRSVHGLLADFASEDSAREKHGATLRRLFASDLESRLVEKDEKPKTVFPFRADEATLNPIWKTRIAGAARLGTDKRQRLLYFNPSAADPAF